MSDMNSLHNRAVWFDIPVANLDRASAFYAATLGIAVTRRRSTTSNFPCSITTRAMAAASSPMRPKSAVTREFSYT